LQKQLEMIRKKIDYNREHGIESDQPLFDFNTIMAGMQQPAAPVASSSTSAANIHAAAAYLASIAGNQPNRNVSDMQAEIQKIERYIASLLANPAK